MEIYEIEQKEGLAELLPNNKISYCAAINIPSYVCIEDIIRAQKLIKADKQSDLHYLDAILASVGTNLNTDTFLKDELWKAKNTIEDKMFNKGHDEQDIIGHIIGSKVFVGNVPDISVYGGEQVPESFHLSSSIVLYKIWQSQELNDRMQQIIADINDGKYFVSLEALFANFDYGLTDETGSQIIVARNSQTAFLTKHLLQYGGKGKYKNYTLSRVLRDMTFRGGGLVEAPANPDSIIFSSMVPFNPIQKSIERVELLDKNIKCGVKSNIEMVLNKENKMAEIDTQLAQAQEEIKKLQKELADSNINKLKEEITSLQEAVTASEEQVTELEKQKTGLEKEVVEYKDELAKQETKLTDASKNIETLTAEVNKIKAEVKTAERVNTLIAAGFTKEEADKKAKVLTSASDDVFAMIVEMAPKKEETETSNASKEDKKVDKKDEDIDEDKNAVTQANLETDDNKDANLGTDNDDSMKLVYQQVSEYLIGEGDKDGS